MTSPRTIEQIAGSTAKEFAERACWSQLNNAEMIDLYLLILAAIKEAAAEAQADKRRLDWLEIEANKVREFAIGPTITGKKWILIQRNGQQNHFGDTLRSAIDAAMQGEGK